MEMNRKKYDYHIISFHYCSLNVFMIWCSYIFPGGCIIMTMFSNDL